MDAEKPEDHGICHPRVIIGRKLRIIEAEFDNFPLRQKQVRKLSAFPFRQEIIVNGLQKIAHTGLKSLNMLHNFFHSTPNRSLFKF